MKDILTMARIQLYILIVFIFFKAVRSSMLEKDMPKSIEVFLYSFPNFCEAILGVLTLTMIGLYLTKKSKIKNNMVYIISTILAAIFVITQELKIHNLGGNNIYDQNDLIFSVIGLVVGYVLITRLQPKLNLE